MFWFNAASEEGSYALMEFKYILCFGSTLTLYTLLPLLLLFKYILCFGSTNFGMGRLLLNNRFKYILCFGSTTEKYTVLEYRYHLKR